jgi:peptidoglycan-associated lipoprotein
MRANPAFAVRALAVAALVFMASACGPKYPKCKDDSNCADKGEVCVEGLCQQCRDDSTCAAGQICKGGRCEAKPECSSNSDCSDNKVCKSGKCQIECNADGDCGSGLKCTNNRCVDALACASNADCTGGMSCVAGRCTNSMANASRSMCDYPTIQFPFNEASLGGSVKEGLQKVAECLKVKGGTITVEGHCDERGTEEYNLSLGDRRARAVSEYLTRLGVPASKLNVVSKGKTQPIDPGSNEDAWAKNRRAEFIER